MINFVVETQQGDKPMAIPEGIGLNLMEVLKASGLPVLATCGGMALCATCQVKVIKGHAELAKPNEAELDMLDTLPDADSTVRLSCQLHVDERLNNCRFKLPDTD